MTNQRIIETIQGITGDITVAHYDAMMKSHSDRGWLNTDAMIKFGVDRLSVLLSSLLMKSSSN
jgi:hypothetical protein